jgi:hypothetical protein
VTTTDVTSFSAAAAQHAVHGGIQPHAAGERTGRDLERTSGSPGLIALHLAHAQPCPNISHNEVEITLQLVQAGQELIVR